MTNLLLFVGALLFGFGMFGFLTRRNLILMFLSLEMMLAGVSLNFIAFGNQHGDLGGQVFVLLILTVAACEAALEMTLEYCKQRTAFGKPIGSFQNSRFKLAEMKTEIEIGRVFVDRCIEELLEGALTPEVAAMAKWWTSDLQKRVVDECVQLHGGYGYMSEYNISRWYADTRLGRIAGGTDEIMKELIGRTL